MTDWAAIAGDVARSLLGEPTTATRQELRYGRRGSLSIDTRHGRWFDHEAGEGGGVLDLVRRERQCTAKEALEWLRSGGYLEDEQSRAPQTGPTAPPQRPTTPAGPDPRRRLARRLWTATEPAVAPEGRAYLAGRLAWPPADLPSAPDLPPTVRWLARAAQPPRDENAKWYGLPPSAAGALVFTWLRPTGVEPCAVSLLAVTAAGDRVPWFGPQRVKVRTVATRVGAAFVARDARPELPVHLCEGEIDALALSLAPWTGPGTVLTAGGTAGMRRYEPIGTGPVLLYCDPDRGGRTAALDASERLRATGRETRIVWSELDPADELAEWLNGRTAALTEDELDPTEATRLAWTTLLEAQPCVRSA